MSVASSADAEVSELQLKLACVAQEQHEADRRGSERTALPGQEKLVERLQESLKNNDITPRSAIYQIFMNEKNGAAYKQCDTHEKKKAFRLEWAKAALEKASVEVGRTKTEEWQDVSEEIGTYEPFDRIVWLEGGHQSPDAIAAAKLYCEKALKMKGKWLSWNPMTERVDVLYVKVTHKSVFSRMWGIYCKDTSISTPGAVTTPPVDTTPVKTSATTTGKAAAAVGGGDGGKETTAAAAGRGQKRSAGGNKGAAEGEKGQADDTESAAKKIRADVIRKAGLTKTAYIRASSVHGQIMHSINTDSAYSWAKNDMTVGKLKEKMQAVQDRVDKHAFFKFYLVNDIQVVRQLYKADDLQRLLPLFVTELEKLIQQVQDEHVRFNKMHVASLQ